MIPRVTFFALRPLRVDSEIRQFGDLVPEAAFWGRRAESLVAQGFLAAALVESLSQETQDEIFDYCATKEALEAEESQ